jgi:predicted nuclease of restriction endonuclease-like RecB superfamily
LQTNLALAQTVVMRASHVSLRVEGGLRPIVRLAKFRGLLCVVSAPPGGAPPRLEISGPFSLFRHTLVYGRASPSLCRTSPGAPASSSPPPPACAAASPRSRSRAATRSSRRARPAPFDSRLEERFAADVARLAPDWDVLREPVPLQAGTTLIFPDFLLRHRIHPERQALVEIVGFWTPQYLGEKLARLRQAAAGAGPTAFVLCVDEELGCAAAEIPRACRSSRSGVAWTPRP